MAGDPGLLAMKSSINSLSRIHLKGERANKVRKHDRAHADYATADLRTCFTCIYLTFTSR